jgi:phosphatidylinositol kinase/protein kinase (PI-3  family)
MDLHVLTWLYGSITTELFETVTSPSPSARAVWLLLKQQFVGNRETRVLLVDTEFRTFKQGNLSISDYCRRMKSLADSLIELGEPVSDRTINVLRGLNEKFEYMRPILKRQRPLLSFAEVRSDLLLEELTVGSPSSTPPSALVAGTTGAPSPS